MEPKPKPNENSPPNKKPPKDSPHKEKHSKETLSSKLSSKLKGFEFKKRDHDGSGDSAKVCKDESELQHKNKKVKLEPHDKEKPPKDARDSYIRKETPQKEVKTKHEQVKSEKESQKVSGHSSKGEKLSPIKKEEENKTSNPVATPKKVTPKKSVKEDSQPGDTTPQDEKKQAARNSYLKFLKRSGPANPGSKPIPEVSKVSLPLQWLLIQ